jgi:hypothetical protein
MVWGESVRRGGEGQNRTVDTTIFSRLEALSPTTPDRSPRQILREFIEWPLLTGHLRPKQLRRNYAVRKSFFGKGEEIP